MSLFIRGVSKQFFYTPMVSFPTQEQQSFVLNKQKKCLYAKIKHSNGLIEYASIQMNKENKINLVKCYLREDKNWELQNTYIINFETNTSLKIHHQMEENQATESYHAAVRFNKLAQVESIDMNFFEYENYQKAYRIFYNNNLCTQIESAENQTTFTYFFEYDKQDRLIKYLSDDKKTIDFDTINYFEDYYEENSYIVGKLIGKHLKAKNNKLIESTSFYHVENSSVIYARKTIEAQQTIIILKSKNQKDYERLAYAIFNKTEDYCTIFNDSNESIFTVFFCERSFENLELKNERCWYNQRFELVKEDSITPEYLLSFVDFTKNMQVFLNNR